MRRLKRDVRPKRLTSVITTLPTKCSQHSIQLHLPLLAAHRHCIYFFLPPLSPSSLRSQEMTLPNMTTPLPSMKATRDKPSQFLNVSQTRGCWGWKEHWAISFDFNECGSSPC